LGKRRSAYSDASAAAWLVSTGVEQTQLRRHHVHCPALLRREARREQHLLRCVRHAILLNMHRGWWGSGSGRGSGRGSDHGHCGSTGTGTGTGTGPRLRVGRDHVRGERERLRKWRRAVQQLAALLLLAVQLLHQAREAVPARGLRSRGAAGVRGSRRGVSEWCSRERGVSEWCSGGRGVSEWCSRGRGKGGVMECEEAEVGAASLPPLPQRTFERAAEGRRRRRGRRGGGRGGGGALLASHAAAAAPCSRDRAGRVSE
jgi:hypothetical protein